VDYKQTFLVIQRRNKKETVDETVKVGAEIYEDIHGIAPTLLAISPDTVYNSSSPELTVVQDQLVPEGVYYFGKASGDSSNSHAISG
jgi:hypothetical protein